jgi:predicted HTH domain antitoxin
MQVTVEVPDDLAAALNLTRRDPAGAALEAMALEAFRERKLTGYQLRKLLGMPSRFEFWEFLKERQIETYTAEDLEHDLAVMKTLLPST